MSWSNEKSSAGGEYGSHRDSPGELSEREDEDETSSPVAANNPSVEDSLTNFREEWQRELQISPKRNNLETEGTDQEYESPETKARSLFLEGIELERSGKLYEAIQFYRRAMQLVPDIEFRLDNHKTKPVSVQNQDEENNTLNNSDTNSASESDDDEQIKDGELLARIQRKVGRLWTICRPRTDQKDVHISALPIEVLLYIVKWVVSSDLDLRSLEMLSMVCRGFYLCARDEEIWRLACLRVWGLNCGSTPYPTYPTWRDMFIERSRLQFNGCYIGKITYIRSGQNGFQDQFYRCWHLVVYYRYLRFFPDGVVLFLTSSEEPADCVAQLRHKAAARSPILKGYYRLKDDRVTLIIHKNNNGSHGNNNKKPKNRSRGGQQGDNNYSDEIAETTFHMEFQIKSTSKKRHAQLTWTHYSVSTRRLKGDENTCTFDLVANRFPPLYFSRVKSYTAESENPLE